MGFLCVGGDTKSQQRTSSNASKGPERPAFLKVNRQLPSVQVHPAAAAAAAFPQNYCPLSTLDGCAITHDVASLPIIRVSEQEEKSSLCHRLDFFCPQSSVFTCVLDTKFPLLLSELENASSQAF